MSPIAFLYGRTSSDRLTPDPVMDVVILDVGQAETVAMIEVRVLEAHDAEPHKLFLHSEMLKYLNDDARKQMIDAGYIELRNGHTDDDLKAELARSSEEPNSLFAGTRAEWSSGAIPKLSSTDV